MTIRDKTRKILWGRSGNRCAICKHELVIDATPVDDESIIGEECHIVSGQPGGPRFDPAFPPEQVDSYNNLILLCRIHHKMVDDQYEKYTIDTMRQMKANHQQWVSEKLSESLSLKPLRVRQIKQNIPVHLILLTSGKEVLNIVDGLCASSFDHDELENQTEVDLVGSFLETVRDWGDLGPDLGPSERVRVGFDLTKSLKEIENAGFFVFGGREIQILEGGVAGPSDWPVAILRILRKTNQSIIPVNPKELKTEDV